VYKYVIRRISCLFLIKIISIHLVFDFNKSSFDTSSKPNKRTNQVSFYTGRSSVIINISNMKMKRFDASLFLFMIPVIIVFVTFLLTETLGLISK
jgi:hypothetical protein